MVIVSADGTLCASALEAKSNEINTPQQSNIVAPSPSSI